jgi:adenylylsulfate kinase
MTKRILIMGLPGSGKTTLANSLTAELMIANKSVKWINADDVRKQYNDWDFSHEGRVRQAGRMKILTGLSLAEFAICDFVAPLPEQRELFDATWTIWVDTIKEGRFEDTNRAFIAPEKYDFRVTEQNSQHWAKIIVAEIIK